LISVGLTTDRPVPGDYDGDGKFDIAIYRPSTGTWYVLQSSGNYSTSISVVLGMTGDRLVLAIMTVMAGSTWGLSPIHGAVAGSDFQQQHTSTSRERSESAPTFRCPRITLMKTGAGGTGRNDFMRATDFDGDRKADPTIYRPSTGTWYSRSSSSNYSTYTSVVLGTSADRPVSGDFDGDGMADVACIVHPGCGRFCSQAPASRPATTLPGV